MKIENVSQETFDTFRKELSDNGTRMDGLPTTGPGIINYELNGHGVKGKVSYNTASQEVTLDVTQVPFYLPIYAVEDSLEHKLMELQPQLKHSEAAKPEEISGANLNEEHNKTGQI